ncbi:hypothetical protein VTN77DRAFT_5035 [Rasamsonia byssochlamydoides]|uniref:uncharacterized protein n=1 Tax=Rasamsonia byssochlamydoides TaxID=89139 RepID=UPI003742B7AF
MLLPHVEFSSLQRLRNPRRHPYSVLCGRFTLYSFRMGGASPSGHLSRHFKASLPTLGRVSLAGRIQVGLFPKLGVLASVARLLEEGSDFLDQACSIGELRREVWDCNWGSMFPCANGAASSMATTYSLWRSKTIAIPEEVAAKSKTPMEEDKGDGTKLSTVASSSDASTASQPPTPKSPNEKTPDAKDPDPQPINNTPKFRRYQKLHVLRFSRTHEIRDDQRRTEAIDTMLDVLGEILLLIVLISATIITCLFDLFGTAACIVLAILMRICCRLITVKRSADYLQDSERGQVRACMLSAIHQNASTWYLYIGQRGIIDGLLNKSMISSVTSRFGDRGTLLLAYFLRGLSMLQLAAMTYVAAQKWWDGVALLIFILVSWAYELLSCHPSVLVHKWLKKAHVQVEERTFLFSGRVVMVGAIQLFKRNPVSSWMDGIVHPSQRRNVLLQGLGGSQDAYRQGLADLEESDRQWVAQYMHLCHRAADLVNPEKEQKKKEKWGKKSCGILT